MFDKKKEFLSAGRIIKLYKEGRRDFSNVVCNNDDFERMDLHGAIFKEGNLGFCSLLSQ